MTYFKLLFQWSLGMSEVNYEPQLQYYLGWDSNQMLPKYNVGYEVLTAVVKKSYILWDIMVYSPLEVNQCSSETSVDFQYSVISQKT
jgi:hypothetical protein